MTGGIIIERLIELVKADLQDLFVTPLCLHNHKNHVFEMISKNMLNYHRTHLAILVSDSVHIVYRRVTLTKSPHAYKAVDPVGSASQPRLYLANS